MPARRASSRLVACMNELHDDADEIENVLTHYQVPARVQGGRLSKHGTRFYLWLGGSVGATTACVAALTEEIARALGRATCRLGRQGHTIYLELPALPAPTLPALPDHKARATVAPPDSALLGVMANNEPLFARFPSDEVGHLLLCGVTGAGKTALMRAMALSLVEANRPRRWRLVLLDQRHGLGSLADLPHTWGQATTTEAAAGWMVRLSTELRRRQSLENEQEPEPRLLVLIDRVATLLSVGGAPVRLALSRLLEQGRDAGIHLVVSSTRPEPLGALAEAFPLRVVGQMEFPLGRMIPQWVAPESVAALARGEFLALAASGGSWQFRGAWASAEDVALVVQRWQQQSQRVVARPELLALPAPTSARPGGERAPARRAQGGKRWAGPRLVLGRCWRWWLGCGARRRWWGSAWGW
jgi:hypothetical protein